MSSMLPLSRHLGLGLLCMLSSFGVTATAAADSPLTSTPFHEAYLDVPSVARARQGLSVAVMSDLSDPAIPNDVRVAIVNALGWRLRGRASAPQYVQYLARRHHVSPRNLTTAHLAPHELLALGYMSAMDDYRELRPAAVAGELGRATPRILVALARKKAPRDDATRLIRVLIETQHLLHEGRSRWCDVYRTSAPALSQADALRPNARRIIAEYLDHYQRYCRGVPSR